MRPRIALATVVVLTLALVGYGVRAWDRRVDPETAQAYGRDLRLLTTLNARLGAEALKARAGIVGHYDNLVQTEAALRRLHSRLRNPPRFLSEAARAEITRAVDASEQTRRRAEDFLERFKTQHSILRNSLRFVPVLTADIDTYLPETDAGREFKAAVNGLVRDVLLLHVWHDEEASRRIGQRIDELRADSSPAAQRVDLALVLRHAEIVRETNRHVNELAVSFMAEPTEDRARHLAAVYARHRSAAIDAANGRRTVMFLLGCMLLTAVAAYLILRLRELNDLKGRFVSMTSHEFRTPLSVIVSSSEMLQAYGDLWPPEKQADHLARIRGSALEMTHMLDSILMIGRSDAGKLQFKGEPLELQGFCAGVVEAAEQSTGQHNRILCEGPEAPEEVVADANLMRHILENLLSNAIKYSPDGGPVHFGVRREGRDVVFEVRDEGIGISVEDQKHLFETFHRGDNVGKISGTGLGLAIVKRAVDLHRGDVSMHSEVGAGTRFTVRLPCPRSVA